MNLELVWSFLPYSQGVFENALSGKNPCNTVSSVHKKHNELVHLLKSGGERGEGE